MFKGSVFNTVKESQKKCVIIQDKIYVQKMLLYHGWILFGRATDDPQLLAKAVLGVISCMFGGPTFTSKILHLAKLNSPFLYEQIRLTIDAINQPSGIVKAVICDGNRNNQSFFLDCLIQNHRNHG